MKSKITAHFKDGQTFEYNHRNAAPKNAMSCFQESLCSHMKVDASKAFDGVVKIVMDIEDK